MSERNGLPLATASRQQKTLIALWLWASAVLLVFALPGWIESGPRPVAHRIPSPMDRTNGYLSDRIRLFRKAAPLVPRGSSFTVRGSGDDDDMAMYMVALGVLPGRKAAPFTYFGHAFPNLSSEARYLFDATCGTYDEREVRLVRKFDEGCVFERIGKRP